MRNNILHLPDPSLGGVISYLEADFKENHVKNKGCFEETYMILWKSWQNGSRIEITGSYFVRTKLYT